MLPPLPYLPCSLQGVLLLMEGYLILRGASRLDAFSVYPFQTWLLCHAVGRGLNLVNNEEKQVQ